MKIQRGFVLPAVLLLIQIYALLGIAALDQVFLEQKLLSDQKTKRLLLNEAENRLPKLATSIQVLSETCSIPTLSPAQLSARPLSWWSAYSCTEKSSLFRSYYVVENLGQAPCARIRGQEPGSAAYYRLTLLVIKEKDVGQKVMLQSTVVSESPNLDHCDTRPHSVDLGPQSWHELI